MISAEDCLRSTATEWGSSRWGEYRRCQKAHHLKYELGLERKPVIADDDDDDRNTRIDYYAVGTLTHACLQYTSHAAMVGEEADWAEVVKAAGCQAGDRAPFDIGVVYETERLISAYFSHYGVENGGWPEGVTVIDVERELGAPPLQRRADVVLELPSGEIVVGDTKTRAHAIPDARFRFVEDMQTNDQFLGLSYLAQKEYKLESPPAIWVNAIVKTKVPKFDRILVPFSQQQIDTWLETQQAWNSAYLIDTNDHRRDPLPNYSACAPAIGSRCSYFYWCHGSDEKRQQYFQITKKAA